MKKANKLFAIAAFLTLLLSTRCISISANSIEKLDDAGTLLMTTLLDRQYASFVDSSVCYTSDIMTDTESNEFYNYFLKWYSGSSAALGESWTKYDYDLSLTEINGNTLKFSNTVRYWVDNCDFEWSNSDIEYDITIDKTGADYYITAINTTAGDYNDFKRLIDGKAAQQSTHKKTEIQTMSEYVSELISDSQNLSATAESMKSNEEDVADIEQLHQEPLNNDNAVMPLSTAYSYNSGRGKNYAEEYVSSANPCFYSISNNDCTNFVSQCVWAAYGGWSYGDSVSAMTTNIGNKKRMQSSSSASNWFAGSGGGGTAWESVNGLWDFLNTTNSTGPRATKHNNNGICTNITPGNIQIGQVLQVRNGSSGNYRHSVYVAGGVFYDTYSKIQVAQHSENRMRSLMNLINAWGGTSDCYMRQLKFQTAYFDR